jgi:hypothetical protein
MKDHISTSEIRGDTIIQRQLNTLYSEIDGEIVILSKENSEYYGTNRVGARIWNLLDSPLTFKNLIYKLLEEYEVSEERCIENTLHYLNILSQKQLIVIKQ